MTSRRSLFAFPLVLALLASMPGTAQVRPQRDWLQVQSPNFLVMGDVGARELRRTAERLEQLHEGLAALSRSAAAPATDATTVVVFQNENDLRSVSPTYRGRARDVGGYFSPGPMNYMVLLAGLEGGHRVVFHEYLHLRLEGLYGPLPVWLSEGLAEYYSTFDVLDGGRTIQLGRALGQHLATLRQRFLPLTTLGAVDHESPHYNEADKTSVFYAESWALIHYLAHGREGQDAGRLGRFLDAVAAGTPLADASLAQLELTAEVLEKELRTYVRRSIFGLHRISMPQRLAAIETLAATPVAEADAHVVLGALASRTDNANAASEHFQHALAIAPAHALALALLAEEKAKTGVSEEVRTLAERAGAGTSATWLSELHRAIALDSEQPSAADAKTIESALRRAVDLNPQSADSRARLTFHLNREGHDIAISRQMIEEAIRLKPAREAYRLTLASVLLRQDENQAARNILGQLMTRSSRGEIRQAARTLMGYAAKQAIAGQREQEALEAARQLTPATGPDGSDLPGTPEEVSPTSSPASDPALIPVLRPLGDGEHRLAAALTGIDCAGSRVIVSAQTAAGLLRLQAETLEQVEFISHRGDLDDTVSCGDQKRSPVLITFRPGSGPGAPGVIVAVEFVPPGFKLPG